MLSQFASFVILGSTFVSALSTGRIYSPVHRDTVGPALRSKCGQSVADYLKAHPNPSLVEISELTSCDVSLCSAYQAADNAGKVLTLKERSITNIAVGFTPIPPPSDAYGSWYGTKLTLFNASTDTPIFDRSYSESSIREPTVPHNLTFPSWIEAETYAVSKPFAPDVCARPGECYLQWKAFNYYFQPGKKYSQVDTLYASCIDVIIDHDA